METAKKSPDDPYRTPAVVETTHTAIPATDGFDEWVGATYKGNLLAADVTRVLRALYNETKGLKRRVDELERERAIRTAIPWAG